MSFPAAVASSAASAMASVPAINPIEVLISTINTNPYLIGLMMLTLNLGGRFLSMEVSKDQEKFMSHPIVRRFFLFAVLFVATRNIVIATGLSIIVILFIGYLFNENSDLCLWRSTLTPVRKNEESPQEAPIGLTPEEGMIYKRLQDKQTAANVVSKGKPNEVIKEGPSAYQVYLTNLRTIM
jgi:hypothetical protein